MEPKLVRKDIEYQKKTLIIVSVLVACLFIGGSFSLLSNSDETEEVITFKTGNFNLEVATEGTLSLEGELPKSYDDGFKNNDITLTLTNTGSLEIGKYEVKLEGDTGTTLETNYIRYSVSEDEGKTYLASKLLSETNNIIYTGYSLKDTKVLKVKLWIDEKAGEAALKKSYNGNINVELYQNEDTLVDVVKSKLVSNYSGSNESFEGGVVAVNNDGNLYHETISETIREYRYSGQIVNNYVNFNDELWRIIGVFKDEDNQEHVKIVRNEELKEIFPETYMVSETIYKIKGKNSENTAYWNYNETLENPKGYNDWATAGLQYWLNAGSNKETKQPNDGYMSYLYKNAKDMIENEKYYLGAGTNISIDDSNYGLVNTPKEMYENERKVNGCIENKGPIDNSTQKELEKNSTCRVWANHYSTWTGKIGLLYASDYGYSANSNYWNTALRKGSFDLKAANTTWIENDTKAYNHYKMLITPDTSLELTIFGIWDGHLNNRATGEGNANLVFPTLYLKSNVKITSGTGEENNPYTLTME